MNDPRWDMRCALAAVLSCSAGCPRDDDLLSSGGDGVASSSEDDGETGACPPPPTPMADGFDISDPIDSLPLDWRDYCDEGDFAGLASADPMGTIALEFEIYHPVTDGEWATGEFPIFIFSNGNNLFWNNYASLHTQVVGAGYIVANIKSDTSSQTLPRGDRILCTSRLIRNGGVSQDVLDHWDGRFVFAGSSTGGEGAVYAARRYTDFGDVNGESELLGVAAIAPSRNQPGIANQFGDELRSFFGIQGSRDGDVNDHVFGVYDAVQTEGVADEHVNKTIIYADGVRHASWGGCNPGTVDPCPSEKAELLLDHFLVAYLRWIGRGDTSGRELITRAPFEVPAPLAQPQLWPNTGGDPLVLRTFAGGSEECGNQRVVIDGFSNQDAQTSDVAAPVSAMGFDVLEEDAASALTSTKHVTRALRVEWSSPGATLTWDVPESRRAAIGTMDHFSFRLANLLELGLDCGVLSDELDVTVRLVDASEGLAEVTLSAFERELPPPSTFSTLDGDPCGWYDSMHTVRVPLAAFCQANPELDIDAITKIELIFDQESQGKAMIDNLEFNRSLLDEADTCAG